MAGAGGTTCVASGVVDWPVFAALVAGSAAGALTAPPVVRALTTNATFGRRLWALMVLATATYVMSRSLSGLT